MTTGKTIALTRRTFVGKVMSLLFNMLSRLIITFLPRSKRLIIRISLWHYKGPSSQGYGFSSGHVWMRELDCEESWAPKNWHFWMWCWRRLLRVPWTARRSNQSILKEISSEYSLEGLMPKLKLQYFGHLIRRTDLFEKTLMLGKNEGGRKRRWQGMTVGWHHWLNGHEFE